MLEGAETLIRLCGKGILYTIGDSINIDSIIQGVIESNGKATFVE